MVVDDYTCLSGIGWILQSWAAHGNAGICGKELHLTDLPTDLEQQLKHLHGQGFSKQTLEVSESIGSNLDGGGDTSGRPNALPL